MGSGRRQIIKQIDELNHRISNTRKIVSEEKLDPEDQKVTKAECLPIVAALEKKLFELPEQERGIEGLLKRGVEKLMAIDKTYVRGSIEEKRIIIVSIFPEKLTFDGTQYRTTRINEAVGRIYTTSLHFSAQKNRKADNICCFPVW
ncbi:hypothetical protein [Pseudobacter ginsenosidimutans]|uniref:Uncharacterized protein n=1 Tax=Pseudobacter ginsenosidimutans TaxID=661488 RepID=A0A4Q7MSD7_9BACT|nr:hypothetical protein [Pseudobacter ginsenosidimutans]QEC41690.1 hypothetical protein FSB84_08290 [Pseudobacter ginsenosidimutans]RZS71507.1 hypothetical protein EV199_3411 [Pseudobacter ginsenosidimutans]